MRHYPGASDDGLEREGADRDEGGEGGELEEELDAGHHLRGAKLQSEVQAKNLLLLSSDLFK